MGPSIFIDGDLIEQIKRLKPASLLQWGRRSSSTETLMGASAAVGWLETLQWGRRSSSTETGGDGPEEAGRPGASMGPSIFIDGDPSPSGTHTTGWPRFNGAVDLHRRRPAVGVGSPAEPILLQWGRRSSSTETDRPRWGARGSRGASMGPSIFIDGDVRVRLARGRADDARASMGPSIFIDGDDMSAGPIEIACGGLQWGRRSSSTET